MIVTPESSNLVKELNHYIWSDKKSNVPVDDYNHCWSADSMVFTINGPKRIDKIKVGEYVWTSVGPRKVLKVFDNGIKETIEQTMQLGTDIVYLRGTETHKIKTGRTWTEFAKLKQNQEITQLKYLKARNTENTKAKSITAEAQKDCIESFGNIIKEKYQRDTTFTTTTRTQETTILKTYPWSIRKCILDTPEKKEQKIIQNGLKTFTLKELKQPKNGTKVMRVKNGTKSMVRKHGGIESIEPLNVKFAEKNIKQDIAEKANIAITTVKLKHLEKGEKRKERVYDLMIEGQHEYFINGILAHNCIDAARYAFERLSRKRTFVAV